jgi:hypothetical protein
MHPGMWSRRGKRISGSSAQSILAVYPAFGIIIVQKEMGSAQRD